MRTKLSIVTPVHSMDRGDYFFDRLCKSLEYQTFQNFEHVVTKEGFMAENTNAGIKLATGDIIKILYLDDFLWSNKALENLVNGFEGGWAAQGCVHTEGNDTYYNPHVPSWNADIRTGNNTIGSPSVVAFENNDPLLFDENLSYMLDCELYWRMYQRYGEPTIVPSLDIAIGIHPGQTSNIMPNEEKVAEFNYVASVYGLAH